MKVDTSTPPVLPLHLLQMKPPFPFEINGLGQLCRTYDTWGYVNCDPRHFPTRKTSGSTGHDLYSIENARIPANGSVIVSSGLSVELPTGHFGKIEGVTSLGYSRSVMPYCSVIDEDYRDVIKIKLFNFGTEDFIVVKNTIVAQLVIQKYTTPMFKYIADWSKPGNFGAIGRQGGFGPTGR